MISAQRLAETIHRTILADMSATRAHMATQPPAPLDGIPRSAAVLADNWVNETARKLQAAKHHRAYDESTIRDYAENYATMCSRMGSVESRVSYAMYIGIAIPAGKCITREGVAGRLDDPMYWRRQLRKAWTRASDDTVREIGSIRRGKQPFVSDAAVEHRRARQLRTREWGDSRVMVSDDGEQLELLPLMDHSIANPAIRRTEMMVRCRGFEEVAKQRGHLCDFWVVTTPSRFHAQLHQGGENPAWAETRATVRDGQKWLRSMWAKARAKLARLSVTYEGMRTVEPHHDGTPHWNIMVFGTEAALATFGQVIRGYWLSDGGDEPGAQERRVRVTRIDPAKGSATGYIAKYISKNLDGHGAIGDAVSDETGNAAKDDTSRVTAWASVHGIRQFQQIGGPPVGKWRELRRLREPVEPEWIEAAREFADKNSWAGYAGLASGVVLVREVVRNGITTRPACSVNRYGESGRARVVGLRDWCGEVITRPNRWRIEKKCQSPASQSCSDSGSGYGPVAASAGGITSTSARSESCFSSRSDSRSALGPVAIIVRDAQGADKSAGMDLSWVLTVPFRGSAPASGDPRAWTSRETSMAGPHVH